MATRRATVRTTVPAPSLVAAALRPDNTDEMGTAVEDGAVVTTIERETTGGLRSTVDDYVVNLTVALETLAAIEAAGGGPGSGADGDEPTGSEADGADGDGTGGDEPTGSEAHGADGTNTDRP